MGAVVCFLFLLGLLVVTGPYKWALLAATLFSLLLYRSAFTANQMGYACALAWVLFLLSAAVSAAFLALRRRFVYDPDEGGAA